MVLVDTNVICEPTKRRPSAPVIEWLSRHAVVALSAISVTELETGVRTAPADKRERLATWLDGLLASGAVDVVPVDAAVARVAGRLSAETRNRTRPLEDLLIAATALSRGSVLATRNVRHFHGLGVTLVDPWAPSATASR
jgi:predicted nucleic acid-binding protein